MYGGLLMSVGFDAVQPDDVYRRGMSLKKIVEIDTPAHADLFKATIVCSIQVVHGERMLPHLLLLTLRMPRGSTKDWKEATDFGSPNQFIEGAGADAFARGGVSRRARRE